MKYEKLTEKQFRRVVHDAVKAAPKSKLEIWWQHFAEAEEFHSQNGHCRFASGTPLYLWANGARNLWKKGNLEDDQIAALKRLGIERNSTLSETFNTQDNNHNKELRLLNRYRAMQSSGLAPWLERELADIEHNLSVAHNKGLLNSTSARKLGFVKKKPPECKS